MLNFFYIASLLAARPIVANHNGQADGHLALARLSLFNGCVLSQLDTMGHCEGTQAFLMAASVASRKAAHSLYFFLIPHPLTQNVFMVCHVCGNINLSRMEDKCAACFFQCQPGVMFRKSKGTIAVLRVSYAQPFLAYY